MEGKKSQILMYEKNQDETRIGETNEKVARMHFRNTMHHI